MGELDDIGRETAAIMKTMLQIATLVALKTRERGQREAEARVKVTQAKLKEAQELQLREARDSKAADPRNEELAKLIARSIADKANHPTVAPTRGVSLVKDAHSITQTGPGNPVHQGIHYDSVERRAALAAHLEKIGVAPELAKVRMLVEVGQAKPPTEAVRLRPEPAAARPASRPDLGRDNRLAQSVELGR